MPQQAGGDVLGADVGAAIAGGAAGVQDRRNGFEKLDAGPGAGDLQLRPPAMTS